jgi:hypothetical protein
MGVSLFWRSNATRPSIPRGVLLRIPDVNLVPVEPETHPAVFNLTISAIFMGYSSLKFFSLCSRFSRIGHTLP